MSTFKPEKLKQKRLQIDFDANPAGAGDHAIFEASGDLEIQSVVVYAHTAIGGGYTDLTMQSNHSSAFVIIKSGGSGLPAALTQQKQVQYNSTKWVLKSGQRINLTPVGGTVSGGLMEVVIDYIPISGGQLLTTYP